MGGCDCDLLLWKRPVETGKVFAALLVSLVVLKKVNLVTFFLRVVYSVLFVNSSIEFVTRLALGQGLISKYGAREFPNVAGYLRPRVEALMGKLPGYQAQVRGLLVAASPQQSFKAAGALYILHKLVSVFSLWTLTFLSVIGVFTVPVVYIAYQKEIDASLEKVVELAKEKSAEFRHLACEKASPYVKQLEAKVGPLRHYLGKVAPSSDNGAAAPAADAAPVVPVTADAAEEGPDSGLTTSASFPKVPATPIFKKGSVADIDEEMDVSQLKQELKDNKAAATGLQL